MKHLKNATPYGWPRIVLYVFCLFILSSCTKDTPELVETNSSAKNGACAAEVYYDMETTQIKRPVKGYSIEQLTALERASMQPKVTRQLIEGCISDVGSNIVITYKTPKHPIASPAHETAPDPGPRVHKMRVESGSASAYSAEGELLFKREFSTHAFDKLATELGTLDRVDPNAVKKYIETAEAAGNLLTTPNNKLVTIKEEINDGTYINLSTIDIVHFRVLGNTLYDKIGKLVSQTLLNYKEGDMPLLDKKWEVRYTTSPTSEIPIAIESTTLYHKFSVR